MRIVSLCGSLGSASANRAALGLAAERLEGRVTLAVEDVPIADIPALNPDLVDDAPEPVVAMRTVIESADGVLIAAPEYAGGLAGSIKNALDWLVGSSSLYHRPVAVMSAGSTGGEFAIEQLVRTLSWQGALTVDWLGISAPRTKMTPDAGFVDDDTIEAVGRLADRLVAAVEMDAESLLETVTSTVAPFGIDPGRFGDLR